MQNMKRVLVIEDDPVTGLIYKKFLEKAHYQVEIAHDGQAGFYRLHQVPPPDAVILDMMLPGMHGIDVLKKVKAQPRFIALPIVVMTNAFLPNMVNDALKSGATRVYDKATIKPQQLLVILEEVLNLKGYLAHVQPRELERSEGPEVPLETEEPPFVETEARYASAPPPGPPDVLAAANAVERATEIPPGSAMFEDEQALQEFRQMVPERLQELRANYMAFSRAYSTTIQQQELRKLYEKVHALAGSTGLLGLHDLSVMTSALESFIQHLRERPNDGSASALRTLAQAIDFLAYLLRYDHYSDVMTAKTRILVVDDDVISRRAVTTALQRVKLQGLSVGDPVEALRLAQEQAFDLIFLDIQMPRMNGLELCERIRENSQNVMTPIVFVTCQSDFQTKAQSHVCGGTDFIAKPFLFNELGVKALMHLLKSKVKTVSAILPEVPTGRMADTERELIKIAA